MGMRPATINVVDRLTVPVILPRPRNMLLERGVCSMAMAKELPYPRCGCLGRAPSARPFDWLVSTCEEAMAYFWARCAFEAKPLAETQPSFSHREYGRVQTDGLPTKDCSVGALRQFL